MKKLKFFILFMAIALINCERDDICAATTSTTARLLVEFYSDTDNDELENVPRLTVYGEGLVTDPTEESDAIVYDDEDEDYIFDVNTSDLSLPLQVTNENELISVRYVLERNTHFRLDDDDNTESNVDIIEIKYVPKYEYVSRACGYKSIFNITDINLDPDGTDEDTWISNIEIIETVVEDENTVHVYIYH